MIAAMTVALFSAPVLSGELQNGCLHPEAFADMMEYSENIEYIGTGKGETDGLGYTPEYDLLKEEGVYFTAEWNPYEEMVCTYRAENHTIHMISKG